MYDEKLYARVLNYAKRTGDLDIFVLLFLILDLTELTLSSSAFHLMLIFPFANHLRNRY